MTRGPLQAIWMRPKRWRDFQHFHDGRQLTWIKNYIEIDLPGSKFQQLSWADQGRLQALWRLAARLHNNGMIPYDETYLRSALGDKRFAIGSQLVTNWFHIGDEKELKKAANREKRYTRLSQKSALEVRGKRKKEPKAVLVARPPAPGTSAERPLGFDIKETINRSLREVAA